MVPCPVESTIHALGMLLAACRIEIFDLTGHSVLACFEGEHSCVSRYSWSRQAAYSPSRPLCPPPRTPAERGRNGASPRPHHDNVHRHAGALTITTPASVDLGSGAPGTTIGPTALGTVTVTDNRASPWPAGPRRSPRPTSHRRNAARRSLPPMPPIPPAPSRRPGRSQSSRPPQLTLAGAAQTVVAGPPAVATTPRHGTRRSPWPSPPRRSPACTPARSRIPCPDLEEDRAQAS